MYTNKIMAHLTHPRNAGTMADADGVGEVATRFAATGDLHSL